ncbi:hypothetical protein DFO70_101410 [Cytobacillus firmus]|uniref:YhfM-like domain-containing protein n=2 Tax=Cytobacillus TaxID=2675230 RepID=A0A366K5P2_CYTFI|nr:MULTISPECIES: hypothetical protein [Cytobacillus]RBP96597.1 hypothetical protein DFO70_101410 [Cytobacillus firmus]TDX45676.1 hypothetical protein DFO72_102146 [Cytobacillus oceanisediminis]
MKKSPIILSIIIFLLLIGCSKDASNELDLDQLTRVDISQEKSEKEFIITEKEKIKSLREIFSSIEWEADIKPQMAEKEDVIATLFFTYDKNMPERLTEYSIWFSKKDGPAAIFHREKNALGTLDKENAQTLNELITNN